MTLNNSQQDVILARREQVASLRLRKHTQRYIAAALDCNVATVNSDLAVLEAEWRANARKSVEDHRTAQLNELDEVKTYAWGTGQVQHVLQALAQQAKLLGTDTPVPQDNTLTLVAMSADEREARIAALLAERQLALGTRTIHEPTEEDIESLASAREADAFQDEEGEG